jgi:hypothetical protein
LQNLIAASPRIRSNDRSSYATANFGMTAHEKASFATSYELLEQCILSGQMPADDVAYLIQSNGSFAAWLKSRASVRQGPEATPFERADASGHAVDRPNAPAGVRTRTQRQRLRATAR